LTSAAKLVGAVVGIVTAMMSVQRRNKFAWKGKGDNWQQDHFAKGDS